MPIGLLASLLLVDLTDEWFTLLPAGAMESMRADLGLSYAQAGVVFALFPAGGVLGVVLMAAADFVSRRLLGSGGAFVFALCLLAFANGRSFVCSPSQHSSGALPATCSCTRHSSRWPSSQVTSWTRCWRAPTCSDRSVSCSARQVGTTQAVISGLSTVGVVVPQLIGVAADRLGVATSMCLFALAPALILVLVLSGREPVRA